MLETTEKTGKKKHDKNERYREDWRTVGELLINPLSFTQPAQSHGVSISGFPAARSLSDLQIFCWKSSCRLEYKQTFFGVVVLVFLRLFQPVCATLTLFRFVSASFTLTTMAVGNASLGWFGKNKHVDFHNLSSKSANSDFPFTLYVLARHYTTGGTRPPFFPLRWIRSITIFRILAT